MGNEDQRGITWNFGTLATLKMCCRDRETLAEFEWLP